jgi:endonuclease/exonuclease/phosphatase family metal-dependent hydrolase
MSKFLKTVYLVVGIAVGLPVLGVLALLGYLSLTEFSPDKHVAPEICGNGRMMDPSQREFTFFTWNIGYAGMGRETDFFYDGGKMVIPGKEMTTRYFSGIKNLVKANDTVDFIFLQEIDQLAKRSWYIDEVAGLDKVLPGFSRAFAINYDCRYVPMPVQQPMGKVVAGLASYSQIKPARAEVQYYDAFFAWPKRLAFLKRCFVALRFGLDNGKELVVINTHNSAFDSTGALRKRELFILDSVMQVEYKNGNYVVAGGDWNSNPRGFSPSSVIQGDKVVNIEPPVESGFLPGWQFVYDPAKPSNRFADIPYAKGVTRTTIIDFFVVSPNIEVKTVTTIPTGFAYSDHEPVKMAVRLK